MSSEAFQAARDFLLAHRADYDAAYAGFRWPGMDRFNWALDWFDAELARGDSANRPALKIVGAGAVTLSFAELAERSNRVANGLRALGVKRGDRILLMLGNVAPLWETMLAAMKLGAVVIPASTLLMRADLVDRFARGRVRYVLAVPGEAAKFEGIAQGLTLISLGDAPSGWHCYDALLEADAAFAPDGVTHANDPLLLYFTSGTTARPKLVQHSHQSYPVGHLSTMYQLGLLPGDLHLNISSPGWAKHAYSCFFAPWNAGASVFIANPVSKHGAGPVSRHGAGQPRFDARGMLDAIAEHGVTTLCAPPTVWRMFVQEDLRAWKTSLREVCSAGEPLNPEVIEQVRAAWGKTVRDFYGQTETTTLIGNPPAFPVKPGSMGKPMPGYRMRLLDLDGNDAGEGEVCIALDPRPTGLMQGYQRDDGTIPPMTEDVYRAGDVAARDGDGYYTYVGRADDIFKASDYRISPFELESVLIEHSVVAEAAVVPAPDPLRLAVPKAYIVLVAGAAPDRDTALSIFRHLRARLAPFQRVRRIQFAELPKTISGKIRRVELRRAEAERGPGTRASGEFREEDFSEFG